MSAQVADDDVIRTGTIRNWLPLLIATLTLAAGGLTSYVRLTYELEAVTARLASIESGGTQHTRSAIARVEALERGAVELQAVVKEQSTTLDRVDRRLGLLLCRTDRRYCDVER